MERNCSLLIHYDVKGGGAGAAPTEDELRKELEHNDVKKKVRGLKTLILMLLNGQSFPKLLMTVIRYCVTTRAHDLKKLLSIYWEVVVKYDHNGKLLPEMILVCNAILNDLKHPNHFIRGCTLRFLCRVKDLEILQPLLPAIEENLSHNDPYVRKNAVMVVYTIHKNFPDIAPGLFHDGGHMIQTFLETETDQTARRNAFLMLSKIEPDLAVEFFAKNVDKIQKFGTDFQFVLLGLTRQVCKKDPNKKSLFLKSLFQLLQSSNSAIAFESAWTLVSLTSAPTAIRAAIASYVGVLNNTESDNNVRLIVLHKLETLKKYHGKLVQEVLMDVLRVLSVQNRDIRKKTLDICMDLVSPKNINEVILVLKKEVLATQRKDLDQEDSAEYRQMLIKAIHACAIRHPKIAISIVPILVDFLSADSSASGGKDSVVASSATTSANAAFASGSLEVVLFIRELVESYPKMREDVIKRLLDVFGEIGSSQVYRVALWILGEYAVDVSKEMVEESWSAIFDAIGGDNFLSGAPTPSNNDSSSAAERVVAKSKVTILADGTYATQTALSMTETTVSTDSMPSLKKLILGGNYLLGTCVVAALMKLLLKMKKDSKTFLPTDLNHRIIQAVKLSCSILQAGQSTDTAASNQIDKDSFERINLYVKIMLDSVVAGEIEDVILYECRSTLADLLEEQKQLKKSKEIGLESRIIPPDQQINFRQLKGGRGLGLNEAELDDDLDLAKATKGQEADGNVDSLSNTVTSMDEEAQNENVKFTKELQRIYQLTGFGDPVYAEAQLNVHGYDIIVDILVINRTNQTMVDLNVELATLGDLQLVERPVGINLPAKESYNFKANFKVSSTESGQIFGTIVYGEGQKVTCININHIIIDIMDYIKPANCSDERFRSMWAEFEWENKVAVSTKIKDVTLFLDHIVKATNMNCLTKDVKKISKMKRQASQSVHSESTNGENESEFLAANLYAKSIFGEDALVNISVEKVAGSVEGYIRIRAKTQGIALSLGDRINLKQKASDKTFNEMGNVQNETQRPISVA